MINKPYWEGICCRNWSSSPQLRFSPKVVFGLSLFPGISFSTEGASYVWQLQHCGTMSEQGIGVLLRSSPLEEMLMCPRFLGS